MLKDQIQMAIQREEARVPSLPVAARGPNLLRWLITALILLAVMLIIGWWLISKPTQKIKSNNSSISQDQRVSELIQDLFSSEKQVRMKAGDDLIKGWQKDSRVVLELIRYATQHKSNENGIYNTVAVLSEFSSSALQPHQKEILKFIDLASTIGPSTKERAQDLKKRLD